jgi:Flp pilus assembly protein TadB
VTALVLVVLMIGVTAAALRPRSHRSEHTEAPAPTRRSGLAAAWALRRDRRRQPSARAVAGWCDDIARRVRSGSSLREAVTAVPADATTERATSPVRLAVDRGLSIADAVGRVDDTGTHLRLALGVIATASRVGGPSAASIDRTAMLLRQRAGDLEERRSQAAQARLSTHVMTAVPLLMLSVLVATDDDVRSAATSPVGAGCIVAGLVLNTVGWCWMRRIVGRPA